MRTGTAYFKTRPSIFIEAGLPKRIPITEGLHDCDYDVDTGKLGIEPVRFAKACKLDRLRRRGEKTSAYTAQIPLGLNQSDIDRFGGVVTWND